MNRIRELRKHYNYTQQKLANALSITQANLSGWELGKWQPDQEALRKMANLFNVSIDYLLGYDSEHVPLINNNTTNAATIGNNLATLRKANNLNQRDLADFLGITISAYGNYELDQRQPSIENLCKLADYFGVSVDYLIGHEKKSVMERPTSELVENFIREYSELFSERRFIEMAKLYKAVDEEVREAMLIYLVAFMNRQGINTETILGY